MREGKSNTSWLQREKCGELGIYHSVAAAMGLLFSEIYKYVLNKRKRIPKGNQKW